MTTTPLPTYLAHADEYSGQALAMAMLHDRARQLLEDAAQNPAVSSDELAGLPDLPRFKHVTHAGALEGVAALETVVEDAQTYLAVMAAKDPEIWIGGEYESAGAHIRAARAEVADPKSPLAYDLETLGDVIAPVLLKRGEDEVLSRLYRTDPRKKIFTRSKSRYLANVANVAQDQLDPEAWEQLVVDAARDAIDPGITEDAFVHKWVKKGKPAADPLAIHEWLEPGGSLIVLACRTPAQRALVELALTKNGTWTQEHYPVREVVAQLVETLKGESPDQVVSPGD